MICIVCDGQRRVLCPDCHGDSFYECKHGCCKVNCPRDCMDGLVTCPECHGEGTVG